MSSITFTWTVQPSEDGQLLRNYLREEKRISRRALADIKYKGGKITVNDQEVTVRYVVATGDVVTINFPEEKVSEWIKPTMLPLDIVFEDDHLLVLNKPPYLPTIPSKGINEESLAGAVIHYYQENGIRSTFHAINRLDKNTSGLLMIGKHRHIHDLFVKEHVKKNVRRTYLALVHGEVMDSSGTIDAPIGRKEGSIIERTVTDAVDGQSAVTHFEVVERYRGATLVQLKLETGRTHQIRVHLSHKGHPIIGDTLYGGREDGIDRQALHSSVLEFTHPLTDEVHILRRPLPKDMERLVEKWRNNLA
ncbi:23S rRNA pseudouridine1911/1915/1917 synthase [Evansella vedderi]|uniref:Pseudouridine synthase n=2 Tax=Evansella vedderi TaxID=38282 RepID=A0ABT9ZY26_9BACI|nr:23S rRNA pseudouridine1911/1915/1917 synthase [Evansella vedderi]